MARKAYLYSTSLALRWMVRLNIGVLLLLFAASPIVVPIFFNIAEASGNTYYVDTAGTNNGSCGTTSGAGACATLSYIVATRALAGAGDTIQIAAGSYTDNTAMSVPAGVAIHGAGSSITTITTNQNKYIKLQTAVPAVDGSNEISGFNLAASTTNFDGILSSGRNNQKIHDMIFTNWSTVNVGDDGTGLIVDGKYGYDDSTGGVFNSSCVGGEPTLTWCQGAAGVPGVHTAPGITDWATGIQIYNITFNNSGLQITALKGALIHDNTFNNDSGTNVSGIGHTGYWFSGVQVYNNTVNMNSISTSVIAVEMWGIGEDTKFYNNTVSGWVSLVSFDLGKGSASYPLEVYDNQIFISKAMAGTGGVPCLEINAGGVTSTDPVIITRNNIASSGTDRGCSYSMAIYNSNGIFSNVVVSYNIFGTNYYDGSTVRLLTIEDSVGIATLTNMYIYNNVFDGGPNRAGGRVIQNNSSSTLTNTYWENNIFQNMTGNTGLTGNSSMTGHVGMYNYSYNVSPNNFAAAGGSAWNTLSNNTLTAVTPPGFVGGGNKPSPFYTLQSGSPAIDAGTNLGAPYNMGLDPRSSFPWSTMDQNIYGSWEMGAFVYIPNTSGNGNQTEPRYDFLNNSATSATSNHTIVFTLENSLDNTGGSSSDTLAFTFQSNFNLANITCGDVNVATGTRFLFNVASPEPRTNCPNTTTSWGLLVNTASRTITITVPATVRSYVATGTIITVNIGSNANYQNQGTHWIVNPSDAGTKSITIGGTFGGYGQILVSVNTPLQLSATIAETLTLAIAGMPGSGTGGMNSCSSDGTHDAEDSSAINLINTTAASVPFGTLNSSNTFYEGCQKVSITTNAGSGFTIAVREDHSLHTASGLTIADTGCDASGCLQTPSTAAAWVTNTNSGLGISCANAATSSSCWTANPNWVNGTKWAPLANEGKNNSTGGTQTPAIFSGLSTVTSVEVITKAKYRIAVPTGQAAGIYTNLVSFIATPVY